MNKLIIISLMASLLTACTSGQRTKLATEYLGHSKICVGHVDYLVFKTGASVEYKPNGKIEIC